ncbi:MAG: alpha/beta fold hydrolase [Solirubrobacterales bacterium]
MSHSSNLGEPRSVDTPAGTIAYRERGNGDPIVFLHGVLVNGDLWRDVVPALADRYRCITPDWPFGAHVDPLGDGFDPSLPGLAELVDQTLAALDLDRVTLVANDTGGAIAQQLVGSSPGRIARLVLTPCDSFDRFFPPQFRPLQEVARSTALIWVAANALRVRALERLPIGFGQLTSEPLDRELVESFTEPMRSDSAVRRDAARILRAVDRRYTEAAAERLRGYDRPVLLAWGDDDAIFPLEHAHRLAGLFPDARLTIIPGARAFVPLDAPQELADAIGAFLDDL